MLFILLLLLYEFRPKVIHLFAVLREHLLPALLLGLRIKHRPVVYAASGALLVMIRSTGIFLSL